MKPTTEAKSTSSAVDGGQHQSIARLDLLLSALSEHPENGLRLAEVCRATGLGKATAHRLLSGLVAYRLADLDPDSGRYTVGFKVFAWASGVGNRYGLAELARLSAGRGAPVSNLRHERAVLDENELRLLPLLDGEHDQLALSAALGGPVDQLLAGLAQKALLLG